MRITMIKSHDAHAHHKWSMRFQVTLYTFTAKEKITKSLGYRKVFRCALQSISSTYHGQLVGWYVSSVDRSVTLSDFHCVSGSLHSIYRPRDVRYFLKAMTNSFQTWFFQSVFSKLYLAYTSSKLCEFISFFWFYLLHSFSKTVKVSLSKNL